MVGAKILWRRAITHRQAWDTIYETWKNELEIWKLVTTVKPEKQALAVTLSLTGQAKAKALEIDTAQLNTEDGMNILLTALETLFLQDEVDLAYNAYSDFDRLKKEENMSMSDFIIYCAQFYFYFYVFNFM